MHHDRLRAARHHIGTVRHPDRKIFVWYQNRFRDPGIGLLGAAKSFDDRWKVSAGIDEKIVRAVVSECAQERFGGDHRPLSRRCRGHFPPLDRPVPRTSLSFVLRARFYSTEQKLTTEARAPQPCYSAAIRSAG